jgi:hypothetical protein
MGFFDFFRRPAPIAERAELMDFLDAQAAFLGQKGVFEYSRARAGPYGNVLFQDKVFLAELEKSRWLAFPLALAMVGEAVEGVLRPPAGENAAAMRKELANVILATFDRYATPVSVDAVAWQEARSEIERDFNLVNLRSARRVMDIPARFADRYVGVMPIHEKLRAKDAPTIHNYLKVNLCNVHDVFVKRASVPALVEWLAGPR